MLSPKLRRKCRADHHIDSGMPVPRRGTFVPSNPTTGLNERDLIMAMMDPDASGGTMDYFDKNVLKESHSDTWMHRARSLLQVY